jgi:hypothetical protein
VTNVSRCDGPESHFVARRASNTEADLVVIRFHWLGDVRVNSAPANYGPLPL